MARPSADTLLALHPYIIGDSFRVYGDTLPLPKEIWNLNPIKGEWNWSLEEELYHTIDSLFFYYEYWPLTLPVHFSEREWAFSEITLPDAEADTLIRTARRPLRQHDLFAGTRLQRSGSLERGIVVGSNQDFSMQSGLNFDISGYITDDIEVTASLTDRSTPIQPDGTTQTLREFDQVYIRLKHQKGLLQMGDVDLELGQSRFALIDRRLQGVDLQTDFVKHGAYQGAAAVVRGQFHQVRFDGEDGIQGPYRLSGADNEQFIIVLAGSERVYINGRRMVRGEENDYVIDYGLAEITFTSNRIITDHTRITVEFQYLREAYTRTVLAAEANHDHFFNNRVSFGATAIRESDNINLSTQLFLSESEREILEQAGDDPTKAVVSGAERVGYRRDADFILYSKVDTLYNGERHQIFKHIPGDSSGVYRVRFSRVPQGEGDYKRTGRAVNGILYEWAGPGLGNYQPERRLARPVEQRIAALRSSLQATSHLELFGEWAASYRDINRLSPIDNENNSDIGFMGGFRLKPLSTVLGNLSFQLTGHYEGTDFSYFDRAKEVEFDRRWNLTEMANSREIRIEGGGGIDFSERSSLKLGGGFIERSEFEGNRAEVNLISAEEGLPGVNIMMERVESSDQYLNQEGTWWRHNARLNYEQPLFGGMLQPEMEFEYEERLQNKPNTDSLFASSFRFMEFGPALYYQWTDNFRIGSSVRYRQDYAAIGGTLEEESEGITQRYITEYRRGNLIQTRNSVGVRQRRFEEIFQQEQGRLDSRGLLVRSVTDYRPMNRFLETHLLYDANTERRPLLQEAFIEVGPELGQYVWIDLNDDGVQQIDEFFPEQSPNEGTFIKQLVPSEELFPVISLRVRWRNSLDPSRIIDDYDAKYSSWLNFLSGIRWHSLIDITEQNQTERLQDIYLLRLDSFRDDSLTISGRVYLEQELEFFRNHTRRDLRFRADRMVSQNRQASGIEEREAETLQISGGTRISRRLRLMALGKLHRNENLSETFFSRNFSIKGAEIRPDLNIRWHSSLQTGWGFSILRRADDFPAERAVVEGYTLRSDARTTLGRNLQALLRVERRSFSLDGGRATSMGEFELTDGAGLGNTWTWSVRCDYRISDFLRANFQYDGRTVKDGRSIHTLRLTMNAVF